MLFNSVAFFIFFILVTILYFVLKHKYRWGLLLASSCFFYMFFKPEYIFILFFTIIIDYYAGIYLEKFKDHSKKKYFLIASIITNISILAVFKYYNFINENITGISSWLGTSNQIPYLSILLPIGLSFHTFQAMSYTIEVYRGNQKAETHFGIYALYVMFYPQLVAGPIERPQNILHQFYEKHNFDSPRVIEGLKRMLWGLFKKMVIADNLSLIVDKLYDDPNTNSLGFIIAAVFFSFQIYCDFSGYSDIALGAARVMGFRLMENFNLPYFAKSISEFWSKWHISLSSWFRDYLYIPLGGNRVTKSRLYFNLFFVFILSGLWHGAGWNYIFWGGLHGFYLVFSVLTKNARIRTNAFLKLKDNSVILNSWRICITFSLVTFTWIFFRITNLSKAINIIQTISQIRIGTLYSQINGCSSIINGKFVFVLILLVIFILSDKKMDALIKNRLKIVSIWKNYLLYSLLLVSLIMFGFWGKINFIYFQF